MVPHQERLVHIELEAPVEEFMRRSLYILGPEDTADKAAHIMKEPDVGSVLVSTNGRPAGIVTERDMLLKVLGEGKDHPGLRAHEVLAQRDLWDELAAQVPEAMAEATLVYGPPEECVERLANFAKAGCRHIILEPYWIESKRRREAIEVVGQEVLPSVRGLSFGCRLLDRNVKWALSYSSRQPSPATSHSQLPDPGAFCPSIGKI